VKHPVYLFAISPRLRVASRARDVTEIEFCLISEILREYTEYIRHPLHTIDEVRQDTAPRARRIEEHPSRVFTEISRLHLPSLSPAMNILMSLGAGR
jgi:hypothetical protein